MNKGRHNSRANSGSWDLSDLDTFTEVGAKLADSYVSIASRGMMIPNSGFCHRIREQLDGCDYVLLSYSRNSNAIVMQFTDDSHAPGAIKITKRGKGISFGARTFFHWYQLSLDDTKGRYEPKPVHISKKGDCWLLELNKKSANLSA